MKAILWDFDGPLADSERNWSLANKRAICELVPDNQIDWEHYFKLGRPRLVGKGMQEIAMVTNSMYDLKICATELDLCARKHYKALTVEQPVALAKGALELVVSFNLEGYKQIIGTGSRKDIVKEFLTRHKLQGIFVDTITAETCVSDTRSLLSEQSFCMDKPAPDIWLKCMEKVEAKPEECVIIEDGFEGIIAGQRAGVKNIVFIPAFEIWYQECTNNKTYRTDISWQSVSVYKNLQEFFLNTNLIAYGRKNLECK